ncbi:MAG: class I SAM-dependent methyltransferase [Firmicutes bacterium]|nr:class I SAM-dependent methyltransferase [Bacillota bacterium]
MEAYKNLAHMYDELMDDISYGEWYNYILEIFEKRQIKPREILEMACGTGNLTEFFLKESYNVTCFDLSDEMLTVAYSKLRRYKNVTIRKQDMVDFELNKTFDVVLSICDSLNYIIDYDDLVKVFKNVYKHLNKDGYFIFDINSYYKLSKIIGNNTFVNDTEEIFYVWENNFIENKNIVEFYLNFFIKENDSYLRFQEVHTQKAYKKHQIITALKEANFINISSFEAFTFNHPNNNSERINFVVKK